MGDRRKLKQMAANLLLSLGGVGFGIIVMEIGLRIAGISYPSFYQVDPYRGHALISNYSAQWTHEGNGHVSLNQDSLRDKDHDLVKPSNTYRIAILGDSFSEAIQVNAEETFWAILAENLSACAALTGKKIEVINFGVGDYGTAQELMTLKHEVWKYKPDLVLLEIFTGNDLVNNSKALSPSDRFAPFLVKKQGKFVWDMSFQDSDTYRRRGSQFRQALFWLINHSRVLQVINEAKRAITTHQPLVGSASNSSKDDKTAIIPALDFDVNLYREPQEQNWQEAWEITEALLKEMNQEVKAKGAKFLAVTLSNPPQVYPDLQVREALKRQGATNLFYPDQRIQKIGQSNGFEVLNLAPTFQRYGDQNNVFLHGFDNTAMGIGHWNKAGHQLGGKMIANYVCTWLSR